MENVKTKQIFNIYCETCNVWGIPIMYQVITANNEKLSVMKFIEIIQNDLLKQFNHPHIDNLHYFIGNDINTWDLCLDYSIIDYDLAMEVRDYLKENYQFNIEVKD